MTALFDPTIAPPLQQGSAEVSVPLPAGRTETMFFALDGSVTSSNAAGSSRSMGIAVDPEGNISKG